MSDKIFYHPDRVPPRFRPFKAIGHFRNLIADKEDTEQVFHIFESLPRRAFIDDARSFVASDKGRSLIASEPSLPDLLDDHAAIRKLPANSVGHAYVEFMEREGLTAAGLVAESDKMRGPDRKFDDQLQWYGNRQRDTHDLLHVLTGYGRDAMGEQCVLAFTYSQNKGWANLLIAYAGAFELRRRVRAGAPIWSAVREAQKLGKACKRVSEEDISALLAEPLESARARLGIGKPTIYQKAHQIFRSQGIDPYDFLAGKAATA